MSLARRLLLGALAAVMIAVVGPSAATAEPLRVYAAGSLVAPMKELIAASGLPPEAVATPTFGPAGLLRERIEAGEAVDLFASADLAQAERLAGKAGRLAVVPFARNRLCVVSRAPLGSDADDLLDRLLDPSLRLATSTPGADPGGDYAFAVFDKAEALRPGAGAILRDKALKLLGSPGAMVPVAGRSPSASIFLADRADALIYYCRGAAATLVEEPGLVSAPLPPTLEVHPVYGLTVSGGNADAMRLALFMLSADGQRILARHGLLPIGDMAGR